MRAVFALVGAAVGYGFGVFASDLVCAAIGVHDNPTKMPATVIILACGAAFCVLGIRLAPALSERGRRAKSRQKWPTMLPALGAAFGPVIGYFAVYCLDRGVKTDVHGPLDIVVRLFFGAPIGALLFCLFGLYLGAAPDRRSRRSVSQSENPDSTC